ncbi:hypothetical protein DB88DRAFT_507957 [Papiliotrema laurentii]|uniref:Ergosterol biosynthetic protein 28 n=1 Tax=Papiliotrema laurentii TaxID=5418 RepID=A0AAD9FXM8_PAPLA|nr:hypothetical protein DB88DRAFT_507957 [Papiliotrema laurentii]
MSYLPLLPAQGGYLPYFLLLGGTAGLYNTIQNFFTSAQTKELYSGQQQQVSRLTCRLFGLYTGIVSVIRFYAAYNITNQPVYDLALIAHAFALWHFTTEMVAFGSVKVNRASISPFIVATTGIVWMWSQRAFYTGA